MRLVESRIEDRGVKDAADGATERIYFHVEGDGNLDGLVLIDSTYEEADHVSNVHRHTFPFPYREVSNKDVVVVYSCQGKDDTITIESPDGTASRCHRFFMNLASTVWEKSSDKCYIGRLRVLWAFDV